MPRPGKHISTFAPFCREGVERAASGESSPPAQAPLGAAGWEDGGYSCPWPRSVRRGPHPAAQAPPAALAVAVALPKALRHRNEVLMRQRRRMRGRRPRGTTSGIRRPGPEKDLELRLSETRGQPLRRTEPSGCAQRARARARNAPHPPPRSLLRLRRALTACGACVHPRGCRHGNRAGLGSSWGRGRCLRLQHCSPRGSGSGLFSPPVVGRHRLCPRPREKTLTPGTREGAWAPPPCFQGAPAPGY